MLYVHTSRIFQKSKSILEDITDFFSSTNDFTAQLQVSLQ